MASKLITPLIITLLALNSIPLVYSEEMIPQGFEGVSWKNVIPLKRVAFVGFDEDSYLDDYSYLASIPANTFYDDTSNKIISNPLLYYDPPRNDKALDSNMGINYFMDDWIKYCGELDQIQIINTNQNEIKQKWEATSYLEINEEDPYETASKIAISNWEKSNTAIVANIEENFEDINEKFQDSITGTIPGGYTISQKTLENNRQVGIPPQHNNFTISTPYKYITANMTWRERFFVPLLGWKTGVDPDLQLYDWQMGLVDSTSNWLSWYEQTEGYVYNYGDWSASVTYMPTKTLGMSYEQLIEKEDIPTNNRGLNIFSNLVKIFDFLPGGTRILNTLSNNGVHYSIDLTFYPGDDYKLPVKTPYGCRNAQFNLQWSTNDVKLGLLIRDPSGATLATSLTDSTSPITLPIKELGEGNYSVTILKLNDYPNDINFDLQFFWEQKFTREEGQALHSAAEGAILAALTNAPLLYTSPQDLPSSTKEALDTLDVNEIYYINLGNYQTDKIQKSLKKIGSVTEYTDYKTLFSTIQSITKQNDLIFTTINPWSYWKAGELTPAGEKRYAFYIGPAAYAAAHHGSPLLITDLHPQLSCSNAWHNYEWERLSQDRDKPHIGGMIQTGHAVYEFIQDIKFDKLGQESMLTVAGQFDIGTTWDRVFAGVAYPGRIMGTPVDTAYWISRSVFYPAMIFSNPALDKNGVWRTTGSQSERKAGTLRITQPQQEINVNYPILETWVTHEYRFNERGSEYWGLDYVSAQGVTPYHEPSPYPIDDGATRPYQPGQYYPDMTMSEVTNFYAKKMGFNSIYSTNFHSTMENLNQGVLLWIEMAHGFHHDTGLLGFWRVNHKESNPWRGYEPGGSTKNPDTYLLGRTFGYNIVPSKAVGMYDGLVITDLPQQYIQTKFYTGEEIYDALENAHSASFMGGSCLISNTLLHLALIRHGFIFQVIDPWSTSWYSTFGFQVFVRELVFGKTVGEAYAEMISHMGVEYLTEQWWWDMWENIEYFGDPDLKIYSPYDSWEKPNLLSCDMIVGGHFLGMPNHDNDKNSIPGFETIYIVGVIAIMVFFYRKRK